MSGKSSPPSSHQRKSLADDHLGQAAEALRSSGSPETLYIHSARQSDKPIAHTAARALALGKRVGYSRTAILFAALACEAFINEFLDEHLSGADLDATDRLTTLDKYVLGPRLAIGRPLLERGHEPAQSIRDLFRLRDRLVHSKPREVPKRVSLFDDPAEFDTYNPEAAAKFIVAVADAATELGHHSGGEPLQNFTVAAITLGRKVILDYGKNAKQSLPAIQGVPVEDLVMQAVHAVTDHSGDHTSP
jgi:hypothetical protein